MDGINIRHFPRRTMNLVSFVWDQLEDKFPRLKLIKTIKEKISSQKIHRIILELRLKQAIVRSKQAIVRSKQIKRREKDILCSLSGRASIIVGAKTYSMGKE